MEIPLPEIIDRLTILKLKVERLSDKFSMEYEAYKKAMKEYQKKGIEVKEEWIDKLYKINTEIWKLEFDIKMGRENKLTLEEIGRRALAIRDLNKQRIAVKNEIARLSKSGFEEVKIDHASDNSL